MTRMIQHTQHPLHTKLPPGPRARGAPPPGEEDLAGAAKILEMIDRGQLSKGRSDEPINIPCHASGRPRRKLTIQEEQDLALRIQSVGDIEARNTLVLANLGLVHMVAQQMHQLHLRYEDLVQEGVIGLLRATETFEPDRGIRFSTYSVYWIRAKIQRHLQRLDRDNVPNVPGSNMEEDDQGQRKRPRAPVLSLAAPQRVSENGETLGDTIAAADPGPEVDVNQSEVDLIVRQTMCEVAAELNDPRIEIIITHRLLAEEPETLAILGKRLNLSREGVRLLENKVVKLARERLQALHDELGREE